MNGDVDFGCDQHDFTPTASQFGDASRIFHPLFVATAKERPSANISQTLPLAYQYDVSGHTEQVVERYLELASKDDYSLRLVATPCIDDHLVAPENFETTGAIAPVAARIILKAF